MNTTWCQADMNYVSGIEPRPVRVSIMNGRTHPPGRWQDCGFELKPHHSAVTNWDDDAEIERVHYAEIAEFARALTGCDHALVGGHIKRNPEKASEHSDLAPITFVHSDFAESYGDLIRQRYRDPGEQAQHGLARAGLKPEDIDRAKHMVIIQFWRNLGPVKMDMPIAFCDARTVGPDEVLRFPVTDYAGGGFDFETLGISAPADPAQHHWYSYPELQQDEVVVFRTYDSEMVEQQTRFWTPHSAFRDPEVDIGQPSRRSIELRATCLFF